MMDHVRFFKALGDDIRLDIVRCLMHSERVLDDFIPIDDENTSMHRNLDMLSEAGVIESVKTGHVNSYRLKDGVLDMLVEFGISPLTEFRKPDSHDSLDIKDAVREKYGRIASDGGNCRCAKSCCGKDDFDPLILSKAIGYSQEDMDVAPDSNLGLGCGNPTAMGSINPGETVLDMGSGAGIDSFLAARKVGDDGRVIGVDMTEDMILKARENALNYGFDNVEFRWGDIENMPVETSSVDVVLSNCVINLAPDKNSAFQEAYRVLKPDGRMYLSDMVLTGQLSEEQRADGDLISGCVAGAVTRDEYLDMMETAGFCIEDIREDRSVSEEQYDGLPVASLHIRAVKRTA